MPAKLTVKSQTGSIRPVVGPTVGTPSIFLSPSRAWQGRRKWAEQEVGCGREEMTSTSATQLVWKVAASVYASACLRAWDRRRRTAEWKLWRVRLHCRGLEWRVLIEKGRNLERLDFTKCTHFSSLPIKPRWSRDYVCTSKALQVRASLGQRVCM